MDLRARIDIKAFTKLLCAKHQEKGGAALCLDRDFTDALYAISCDAAHKVEMHNLMVDEETLNIPGPILNRKAVAGFLFAHRKDPRLGGPTSVVWSVYNEQTRMSHVGFAAIVLPKQAPKAEELVHAGEHSA